MSECGMLLWFSFRHAIALEKKYEPPRLIEGGGS